MKKINSKVVPLASGETGNIVINEEALAARLYEFSRDTAFFEANRGELLKKYPDRWVAVYRERVVADAPSSRSIIRKLDEQGIPPGAAAVQFMRSEPVLRVI